MLTKPKRSRTGESKRARDDDDESGPAPDTGHRSSCHRCGNLRKRNILCGNCPHIFCQRCGEKEVMEYGPDIFTGKGVQRMMHS